MEYKPLPFPIPPEVEADLCDPGSPPEGHVRVVLLKINDAGPVVWPANEEVIGLIYSEFGHKSEHEQDVASEAEPVEGVEAPCVECSIVDYRIDTCPQEILDLLPEYEP